MRFDYYPTIYDIDFSKYKRLKAVLLDIDNTLAPYGRYKLSEELVTYISDLKTCGCDVILYSNSPTKRIQKFAKMLHVRYFSRAFKPFSCELKRYLIAKQYSPSEVLMIGDQIFTDVFAANRYNVNMALIEPISKVEGPFAKFKRVLEYPAKAKARKLYWQRRN